MNILQKIIKKHPQISFMIFVKIYWIISFSFTIFVIQNQIPTLRQWLLGSLFTILTLPVNYWLTYSFTPEKEE